MRLTNNIDKDKWMKLIEEEALCDSIECGSRATITLPEFIYDRLVNTTQRLQSETDTLRDRLVVSNLALFDLISMTSSASHKKLINEILEKNREIIANA